jgi:hypothetical protein
MGVGEIEVCGRLKGEDGLVVFSLKISDKGYYEMFDATSSKINKSLTEETTDFF